MIITFFGHSDFQEKSIHKKMLLDILENSIKGQNVLFYVGGYGKFDRFAEQCAREYKKLHSNASILLVTPYLQRLPPNSSPTNTYDDILFPALEKIPLKYTILKRNQYMAEQADLIVTYVHHSFGGAYQAAEYAKKKGKKTINLPL